MLIKAGTASTARMLRMFDPTMLPIAISGCPFIAAPTVAASSGKLVPMATIVSPIIMLLMPRSKAICVAAYTSSWAEASNAANPANSQNKALLCFISGSSSSSLVKALSAGSASRSDRSNCQRI